MNNPIPSQGFKEELPKLLKTIHAYVSGTYGQHYVTQDTSNAPESTVQVVDLWANVGVAEAAFQADLIKYSSRYGRKGGKNPKDLLKIMHYAMLLYYFDHVRNTSTTADIATPDVDK